MLNKCVSGLDKTLETFFKNVMGIPSRPIARELLQFDSAFLTSCSVNTIIEEEILLITGNGHKGACTYVVSKYLLKIDATSETSVVNKFLFVKRENSGLPFDNLFF